MTTQVDDKQDAILKATLKLISENGFHGTAMSKIAKEAGVSAGIIYHYFASKDELIDELYKRIKWDFSQVMNQEFDPDQPLQAQIRQLLAIMMRYYLKRPRESAFMEQYKRSPYYRAEIEAETSQYYSVMLQSFQRAKQEMIIKELPDVVFMAFTLDVAMSLAQQHAMGFIEMNDALIAQVTDAAWQAIRR